MSDRIDFCSVSVLAWKVVAGLLDPGAASSSPGATILRPPCEALARIIHEPGERVVTIAANVAQQMLGPNPARCVCNEARAQEIVRDSLLYALGRRDSPFCGSEPTAAQKRVLTQGRLKAIEGRRASEKRAPSAKAGPAQALPPLRGDRTVARAHLQAPMLGAPRRTVLALIVGRRSRMGPYGRIFQCYPLFRERRLFRLAKGCDRAGCRWSWPEGSSAMHVEA
jgi:hypothetical protein